MCRIERCDEPVRARFERERVRWAVLDAYAAADTALGDDVRFFASIFFCHLYCVDWTNFQTFPTADAFFRVNLRNKVRADSLRYAETLDGEHRLAAAGAAVADEIDAAADVLAELYEVIVVCLCEEVAALGCVYLTRVPVLDKRCGCSVESHAYVHRRVAGVSFVHRLMAAVAHADAYMRRRVYDVCSALVVENLEQVNQYSQPLHQLIL